ncbi:lipoprotein [Escherichia albertii]|nr:lipoprotein [Escherichia albertii]ELY3288668.1 lipoprotein [Escherichia albertii]HEB1328014.1 lipoprotein [Escherichia albertii]HEB1550821.1 lipoprotein [Escherichia albertii]
MMKKLAIAGALMLLAGCAEVQNYNNVVKTPAPDWLAGYWQTKGPQSSLVSPEAIGSLIVTKDGDTLDCRQWQRVIALPGKLTLMSDDLTNVTVKRELYEIERDGNTIEYDGMTMERVDRPTPECAAVLKKRRYRRRCRDEIPRSRGLLCQTKKRPMRKLIGPTTAMI